MEEDLISGVNPLGRGTQQCFQVPTEMIYLYNKIGTEHLQRITFIELISFQDVNDTVWIDYIQEFVSLEETRDGQTEDLEDALTEALERELDHLERVKSFGRASQYNRTIDNSPVTLRIDRYSFFTKQ